MFRIFDRYVWLRYLLPFVLIYFVSFLYVEFASFFFGRVFFLFYPAVIFIALVCGFGPGVLSTFMASLIIWEFLNTSPYDVDPSLLNQEFWQVFIFSFSGILFSIIGGNYRNLRIQGEIAIDDALTLLEKNLNSILVLNEEFKIRFANQAFYQTFQIKPAEINGKCIFDLGKERWKNSSFKQMVESVYYEGKEFHGFEVRLDFPEAGSKHFVINAVKIHLSASNSDAILLTIEDSTEVKKIMHALLTSEEKYRNLVSTAYDGIMIIKLDGTIEFANAQIEKMFGYKKGDLPGKNYEIMQREEDRKKHEEYHNHYIENPTPREMGKGLNLVGRRFDGSCFPIDVSLSPFRSNSDTYINCVVRDVTLEKNAEEDRKQLLEEEKELRKAAVNANRVKDDFLSTLSHEIRTPLTTILGWTQELLAENPNTTFRSGLQVIERSALLQGQLIDDLLDISRIQSGKLIIEKKIVNLVDTLKQTVSAAELLAEKKNIRIEVSWQDLDFNVLVDPIRMQQIFWNLFTNAIKFTPDHGTISLKIAMQEKNNTSWVEVSVSDSGIGISSEFLERIFQRFNQADSSITRVHGGLGLGLAIVKSLIEMQGGSVTASSPGLGLGATFVVKMPLLSIKKKGSVDSSAIDNDLKNSSLEATKILIVDDSPDNRNLFALILKSLGADVDSASSVKEALQKFSIFKPDILLSDISMPEEDGYILIKKIRALDPSEGGNIPDIALTAYAGGEDIKRSIETGFTDHISKPVSRTSLCKKIRSVLLANSGKKVWPLVSTEMSGVAD